MIILVKQISVAELKTIAGNLYGEMIKAVVDIDRNLIAIDAELHSDLESLLLQDGSQQESLWGINLYPDLYGETDFVEYDSLINIRPRQNNKSRFVEDKSNREAISNVVNSFVTE